MGRYIPLGKFLSIAPTPFIRCVTCRRYPKLLPDIRKYFRAKIAGETDVSQVAFHSEWLVPKGYVPSIHTFLNHYYGCETRAYAREKAGSKESAT